MKILFDGGSFKIVRDKNLVKIKGNPNIDFEPWDISYTLKLFNVMSNLMDECENVDVCIGEQRFENYLKEDFTSKNRLISYINVLLDGLPVVFSISNIEKEISISFFNKIDVEYGTIAFSITRDKFKEEYDNIKNKLSRFLENTNNKYDFSSEMDKEWYVDSYTGNLIFKDKNE